MHSNNINGFFHDGTITTTTASDTTITETTTTTNENNTSSSIQTIMEEGCYDSNSNSNTNNNSKEEELLSKTEISSSSSIIGSPRNTLFATTFLLLGDIMGTGVLSLPNSAAKLGWICTVLALTVFALSAFYSGLLLSKIKQKHPNVRGYSDAAHTLIGPIFGTITRLCITINWGALLIYFFIAIVDSISMITDQYSTTAVGGMLDCQWKKSIIACFLLILPIQCRDYHAMSYLAIPSFIAVVCVIILVLEDLSTKEDIDTNNNEIRIYGSDTRLGVDPNLGFMDLVSSFSSFVFAYQGQSIYLEVMSEMKQPKRFPTSIVFVYCVMWLVYLTTIIIAYGNEGSNVPGFLPDAMSDGPAKVVTAVFILFHVIGAYSITGRSFHRFLHSKLFSQSVDKNTPRGKFDWFVVTGLYLLFTFTVSNAIPFFADIQSLIGSVFGAPIVFGWPVLFYGSMCYSEVVGKAKEEEGDSPSSSPIINKSILHEMGYKHVVFCGVFVFIFLPLFWFVGTVSSISVLIDHIGESAKPFSC